MGIILLVVVIMVVTYIVTFKDEFEAEELQKCALFGIGITALAILYNIIVSL